MSVTVAGPNARSHRAHQFGARNLRRDGVGVDGSQSAIGAHRGRDTVQLPSFGPRTMSPRTDSTVRILGAKGVSPPQRLPGAGS